MTTTNSIKTTLTPKAAYEIGEWLQQALDCAEDSHRLASTVDGDNAFISYILARLDMAQVPDAARISSKLMQMRLDAIVARNGV